MLRAVVYRLLTLGKGYEGRRGEASSRFIFSFWLGRVYLGGCCVLLLVVVLRVSYLCGTLMIINC